MNSTVILEPVSHEWPIWKLKHFRLNSISLPPQLSYMCIYAFYFFQKRQMHQESCKYKQNKKKGFPNWVGERKKTIGEKWEELHNLKILFVVLVTDSKETTSFCEVLYLSMEKKQPGIWVSFLHARMSNLNWICRGWIITHVLFSPWSLSWNCKQLWYRKHWVRASRSEKIKKMI